MRILHVVHSLVPGQYRGGISKVAHELAAAQAGLGHHVEVLTTNLNSGVPTDIPAGTVRTFDGLRVHYFAGQGRAAPALRRHLAAHASQFDVLHAHNPLSPLNRYATAASRGSGIPLFVHLHGALNPYGQESLYRRLRRAAYIRGVERRSLCSAAGVFALSPHESQQARRRVGDARLILLPNGVSLSREAAAADPLRFRRQFDLPQDRQLLTFVGRICDIKGVHLLAAAFARLAPDWPRLHLVIAGNRQQFPEYTAALDRLLDEAGVADRTTWTGFLGEREKLDALAAAELFCHPSETEGMPMAVLEAMAMGLPCVIGEGCFMAEAAAAGAVAECQFTAASVTAQLRRLLGDEMARAAMARRAALHAAEHHAWPSIAAQTIQHYATHAAGAGGARAA